MFPEWLSIDELAAHMGVTRRTITNWRRRGVLPKPTSYANRLRWRVELIEAMQRDGRLPAPKVAR